MSESNIFTRCFFSFHRALTGEESYQLIAPFFFFLRRKGARTQKMWPLKTVEGRTRQKRRRLWWVGEGQGRGGCCAYCTWNVMVSWWWDRDLIVNLRKVRAWTMKEEWHTTEIDEKNRTKEFPGNASGNPPFFFFSSLFASGKTKLFLQMGWQI